MEQSLSHKIIAFFIPLIIGYILGKFKVFKESESKTLMKYVYLIGMPSFLFTQMSETCFTDACSIEFIYSYALSILSVIFISFFFLNKMNIHCNKEIILNCMANGYTNAGFIGIPIFYMLYGTPNESIAVIAFQGLFILTTTIILLDYLDDESSFSLFNTVHKIYVTILKNPLILAAFLGTIVSVTHVDIPPIIKNPISLIGNVGIPTALITVGLTLAQMEPKKTRIGRKKRIIFSLMMKNITHPALAFLFGFYIFNLPLESLEKLIVIAAMPTSLSCSVLAHRHGIFVHRSSQLIFFSTIISMSLLFVFLAYKLLAL